MNTQIFATFGPACGDEDILKQMIGNGMTGMRLNLSHATLHASRFYIQAYKEAAKAMGVKPQILIDMQGPELRVGTLEVPVKLKDGQQLLLFSKGIFVSDKSEEVENQGIAGNHGMVKIPVPEEVITSTKVEDEILLDDGKLLLQVTKSSREYIQAKVIRGGILRGSKSIKIVNVDVKMPVLTEHDMDNIRHAKEYGVTSLMQPFVRGGEELAQVRSFLRENDAEDLQIFAKIENRLGVNNLESILPEADVIVIARGDLGNDMPLWEVPVVQRRIENICKKHNKPYIVVTQMLTSMEENPVPTRAEVSDIFHAVANGAYGVMITGESAVGKYPEEAVKYLANTARTAETVR